MTKRLPVLVERSLGHLRAMKAEIGHRFDRAIVSTSASSGFVPTCKVGCAHCCYHPTYISVFEGMMIYQHLANNRKWTPSLQKRVEDAAKATKGLVDDVWLMAMIPCPLLDVNRECMAYQARPLSCQTRWSFQNASLCHPHQVDHAKPLVSNRDALGVYHGMESQALKDNGVKLVLIPLASAILLGKRVYEGEVAIEDVNREIAQEFAG